MSTPVIQFHAPVATAKPATAPIDFARLVRCIEHKEAHRWTERGGALGWTEAAWREAANEPLARKFAWASSPDVSRFVAERRLHRLATLLADYGHRLTPATVASLWHLGLSGTLLALQRGDAMSYGECVANLYADKGFSP